jgi:hypothetical protein
VTVQVRVGCAGADDGLEDGWVTGGVEAGAAAAGECRRVVFVTALR